MYSVLFERNVSDWVIRDPAVPNDALNGNLTRGIEGESA
jgi:hypothetical protein